MKTTTSYQKFFSWVQKHAGAIIACVLMASLGFGYLVFSAVPTSTSIGNSIIIKSQLGIGTDSPSTLIDAEGGISDYAFLPAGSSAPADVDLANSQYSFWLDEATDQFNLKAKKSGGVVISQTIGSGSGYWTQTGTDLYYNDGNVGIGVTDPDTKLDVNGAITQRPLSSDPADPDSGNSVQWVSDGTGGGDAGDVMMKINVGGITRIKTLADYSSLPTLPTVTTQAVTAIQETTATGNGNITDDGGATATRGMCWATHATPTISDSHATNGTGVGAYTVPMTGLVAETHYYVRAYATNATGTSYGSQVEFDTDPDVGLPTVTTQAVTAIQETTATGNGNITDDGGATATRGMCWATHATPTISDSHATNGTGVGAYTVPMTGLVAETHYYVRAYATNATGTSYGSQVEFDAGTTAWACGDALVDSRDSKSYATVLIGTQCWMAEHLNYGTLTLGINNQGIDCPSAAATEKYCYSDTEGNCTTDGALYQWSQMMCGAASCNGTGESQPACTIPVQGICPSGWHIPSHYEYTALEREVCDSATCATDFPYDESTSGWRGTDEGGQIKGTTICGTYPCWNSPNTGATNSSGFTAWAAGYRYTDGSFGNRGSYARLWSSLESGTSAWFRYLSYGHTGVGRHTYGQAYGFAVRCLRD